jgi:hypothetical protein
MKYAGKRKEENFRFSGGFLRVVQGQHQLPYYRLSPYNTCKAKDIIEHLQCSSYFFMI